MLETVATFHARTNADYAPAPWAQEQGRALGLSESCPTLFRYPGPCGLRDHLRGEGWVGPREARVALWADATLHRDGPGAAYFGTIALLEPLRLSPCRTTPGASLAPRPPRVFATANARFDPERMVWLPPSRLSARLPWDALRHPAEVRALLPDWESERARVEAELHDYLEELLAMSRAGAPGPGVSWCTVPAERRLGLLAEWGVQGRWTAAVTRARAA